MARALGILAAVVIAGGIGIVVWFAGWGVHGCEDWGGNPMCDRMERDGGIAFAGLGVVAGGTVFAFAALMAQLLDRR